MENRFGFRDLVFSVLLVIFIISVLLVAYQIDRQHTTLNEISETLDTHTGDLARINDSVRRLDGQTQRLDRIEQLLQQGVSVNGGGDREQSAPDEVEGQATQAANPIDSDVHTTDEAAAELNVEPTEFEVDGLNPFHRLLDVKARDDYAYGDTLMNVFGAPPDRLTPIISADVYASIIQDYVLESLITRNPETLEWEPWIARDWQVEENLEQWRAYIDQRKQDPLTEDEIREEPQFAQLEGDDAAQQQYVEDRLEEGRTQEQIIQEADAPPAITIRFQIREGVRFSDGEPLTADDVVFTYNWIMNPEVEAQRLRVYYATIKDVEKLGEYEVAFHFREPYFEALDFAGGMNILPEHFYGEYAPSEFNTHPALLMGSGPYRLPSPVGQRPQAGRPIGLVRNERYWGEQPGFDRLVWRIIEQDSARLQTFLNRDIDAFPANAEQYDRLKDDPKVMSWAQRFNFLTVTAGYNYIGWNQMRRGREETTFADVRVRRAMTHLLDRQRIVDDIMHGYARVVSSPFNPLSPQSNPDIEPWPHDVNRGRELLAEAGYEDRDNDGVIEGPDGEPFAFELNYPASSDTSQRIAMFVRDSFARAGIEVTPRPLEWQVLLERIKRTRDFDAVMLGWSGGIENDPYQIFHSSGIEPPGDNATHYSNPELDALMEEARMTIDRDKRMDLWHEIHRILHEDQPYTFMMVSESRLFYDGRIRNIYETRVGLNPTREWYVPADDQRR